MSSAHTTMREEISGTIDYIQFREEVPDEVCRRYEDIKTLLEQTREHKRLLRAAVEYNYNTVELALRLLWRELDEEWTKEKDKNFTIGNLLQWLHSRDYLPDRTKEDPIDDLRRGSQTRDDEDGEENRTPLDPLRRVRNRIIHVKSDSWLGWHGLRHITRSVEIVNRFYEGPELRRERRANRRSINGHCKRLSAEGAALETSDRRELVHAINMLYYDNQADRPIYYFAFWPLFKLEHEPGETFSDHQPILSACTNCTLVDGSLTLQTQTGTEILVDRELTNRERTRLGNWLEEAGLRRRRGFDRFGPPSLRGALLDLRRGFPIQLDELEWIE